VQQECFLQSEVSWQLIQEYHLLASSPVWKSREMLTYQCWLEQQFHHSDRAANVSCPVQQECFLPAIIHRQFSGWCKQNFSFLT
jgi:hypothetical protein